MKASHHVSVGRNDPCPCGSGRKYKLCCQPKKLQQSARRSKALYAVIGVAAVALAVVAARTAFGPSAKTETAQGATNAPVTQLPLSAATLPQPRQTGGFPQPPGPVPEGKVWSPEHGHWHDAAMGQVVTTTGGNMPSATASPGPVPPPPGPAPEGKVWSPEHGHWHDAPGASTVTVTPAPGSTSTDGVTATATPGVPTPAPAPATPPASADTAAPVQPATPQPDAPAPAPTEPAPTPTP